MKTTIDILSPLVEAGVSIYVIPETHTYTHTHTHTVAFDYARFPFQSVSLVQTSQVSEYCTALYNTVIPGHLRLCVCVCCEVFYRHSHTVCSVFVFVNSTVGFGSRTGSTERERECVCGVC